MKKKKLLLCLYVVFFILFALPSFAATPQPVILTYEADNEFPPYRIATVKGFSGFEVDINNAIFKNSPYSLEYKFTHGEWGGADQADTSAATFFGWREITSETPKNMTFSEPLFTHRWGAYTQPYHTGKLDYKLIGAYTAGVTMKRFPYTNLVSKGIKNIRVFENGTDAVRALANGEIDILFDELISLNYLLVQEKLYDAVLYHPEFEVTTPVGLAMRKDSSDLLSFVNRRIKEIRTSGEYETIYEKYFFAHSPLYENQRRETAYKTAAGLVTLFSLLGVFLAFGCYRQLLKAAREKAFADTLIENATSFIVIWDEDLNIVRTNARVERFLGYSKEELTGMKASDVISIPDTISNYTFATRMQSRRGHAIDVLWDINRFSRNNSSRRYVMAAGSDITEITALRQSLEASLDQLRESERRFELATSGGNVGIIYCNMVKNEIYISPVGYKLLGYSQHPENLTNEEWLSWIHPSDIDIFQLNVFTVENVASLNPSSELRIRKKDGGYKWFLFSLKAELDENGSLSVLSGAFLDIDERKKVELLTRRLAFEDPVSGTQNRHYLMTEGEKILLAAQKNNLGVGLVIFDIDDFKMLNMQKGTAAGDQLLREVGNRAKKFLGNVGLLARMSGDEFACLLPFDMSSGINDKLGAATDVLKSIIQEIDATKYGIKRITICAGSSVFPIDSGELSGLIENASAALVAAKTQGPGSTKIYDSNVKNRTKRDDILRHDIQDLIKNNQLKAYYQPKVDLVTGRICGAEALARWVHPDFGIIRPDYFIKVAEDIGVITAIDYFMLRETCLQNAKWQALGLPPVRIAVNMSAEGFFSEKTIEYVYGLLQEAQLDPRWLEIELTESKAMRDIQKAIESMQRLKMLGIMISLDDFGTGYSSLNYLKKLPIRMIKLDRSFILDLESNPASQMIVNTMVQLSKKLNLTVTVEGVENTIQEQYLRNIGCENAQGYLYSKPIPAEKFEALLRSGKPLRPLESYDQRNIA